MEIIFPTILVQAVITVFLIWTSRKAKSEDYFLTLIMCTFLMHIGFKYLLWLINHDGEAYRKMHGSFSLLYGPVLLCYFRTITNKPVTIFFKRTIFIPFLLAFAMSIILTCQIIFNNNYRLLDVYDTLLVPVALVSNLLYAGFILWQTAQPLAADPALRHKLNICRVISAVLLLPPVLFAVNIFLVQNPIDIRIAWYGAILMMYALVLNYRFKISMIAIVPAGKSLADDLGSVKKYAHSSLEVQEKENILWLLENAMRKDKVYRDSDLSLDELASILNVSRHHLTEVLNSSLGLNFYQYVNRFRVEEAKEEILSGNHANFISIAFDCGFKSKSTFNKYFKELTGVSPSEYREKCLTSLQATH